MKWFLWFLQTRKIHMENPCVVWMSCHPRGGWNGGTTVGLFNDAAAGGWVGDPQKVVSLVRESAGQIIATSHDLTPNCGLVREIPLFQGNLGWWNIIISPESALPKVALYNSGYIMVKQLPKGGLYSKEPWQTNTWELRRLLSRWYKDLFHKFPQKVLT